MLLQDCNCEDGCDRCSIELTLSAEAREAVIEVTSEALIRSNSIDDQVPEGRHPDFGVPVGQASGNHILIAKLAPGQELKLKCLARKVGRERLATQKRF